MTLQEAALEYQYDVEVTFGDLGDGPGWYWVINGGYCSVSGRNQYDNIIDAYDELIEFLKTFKPFEK